MAAEPASERGGPALTREAILARFAQAPAPRMRYAPSAVAPYAAGLEEEEPDPLSADPDLTLAELRELRGDHDLNPDMMPTRRLRPAAVLVPLMIHADEIRVLFTRRTATLSSHAGQISFPGGRIDPQDANPASAALRETWEEVGIEPQAIALLGRLDTYVTRTAYEITPMVGFIQAPTPLRLNPGEVAETFEVPLRHLIDPRNLQKHTMDYAGVERSYFAIPYGDYYIWGATAGILANLGEMLGPRM